MVNSKCGRILLWEHFVSYNFQQTNENFDGVCVSIPNTGTNIEMLTLQSHELAPRMFSSHCLRTALSWTAWCRIFFRTSATHLYISPLGCLSVYPSVWWTFVCDGDARVRVPGRCVSQLCATILFPLFLSILLVSIVFLHTLRFKTIPHSDVCGFSSDISRSSDTRSLSLLVPWANGINKSTNKYILDAFRFLSPYLRVGRLNDIIASRLAIRTSMWNTFEREK